MSYVVNGPAIGISKSGLLHYCAPDPNDPLFAIVERVNQRAKGGLLPSEEDLAMLDGLPVFHEEDCEGVALTVEYRNF